MRNVDWGNVTQSIIRYGRKTTFCAVAVVMGALVSGCGMSSLTSGFGTSLFGGSSKKETQIGNVSEETLLAAAQSDNAGTTASVANRCPKFEIWRQDQTFTVYEQGREGDGLAIVHRGEITKTARECQIEPGRLTIKYGFSGRVLLGPRGVAGTLDLPVSVYVTNPNREKIQSDSIRISVTVPPNKPIAYFSSVKTLSFTIPEGVRPVDYRIYVAFERKPTG